MLAISDYAAYESASSTYCIPSLDIHTSTELHPSIQNLIADVRSCSFTARMRNNAE